MGVHGRLDWLYASGNNESEALSILLRGGALWQQISHELTTVGGNTRKLEIPDRGGGYNA